MSIGQKQISGVTQEVAYSSIGERLEGSAHSTFPGGQDAPLAGTDSVGDAQQVAMDTLPQAGSTTSPDTSREADKACRVEEYDFRALDLANEKRAAEKRVETRAKLLTELRALGVTRIYMQYEGYADAGNVEHVEVAPNTSKLTDELRRRVEDFGWDFAYALKPGFEVNEGGDGELNWDVEADEIDVCHSTRYIETTFHGGL